MFSTNGRPAKSPNTVRKQDLDKELLAAFASHDTGRIAELYHQAGDALAADDINAACFYWTHAYVFALEAGHRDTAIIHKKLIAEGREE